MSSKEAGGFNNTRNREWGKKSAEQGWKSELARREQEAWQNTLGIRVEVKPLPDTVTPEVRKNLKEMGFDLRYVPALDLGNKSYLRERGVDGYLAELEQKYPKWKPFGSLLARERADHAVPINLKELYWELVKDGRVAFPVLTGQWMAIETVDKPSYGKEYARTPFTERLGFRNDRFNVSWDDAHNAIEREKPKILSNIGVSRQSGDVRFLEAIEWNLVGNREGWGKTNTWEWTNTEYLGPHGSERIIIGHSHWGGAGDVNFYLPGHPHEAVGFRHAVALGS